MHPKAARTNLPHHTPHTLAEVPCSAEEKESNLTPFPPPSADPPSKLASGWPGDGRRRAVPEPPKPVSGPPVTVSRMVIVRPEVRPVSRMRHRRWHVGDHVVPLPRDLRLIQDDLGSVGHGSSPLPGVRRRPAMLCPFCVTYVARCPMATNCAVATPLVRRRAGRRRPVSAAFNCASKALKPAGVSRVTEDLCSAEKKESKMTLFLPLSVDLPPKAERVGREREGERVGRERERGTGRAGAGRAGTNRRSGI